jgi:hypothetical protein
MAWEGLGGRIEIGETPRHAMCREFMELSGVKILESAWRPIGAFERSSLHVECFSARTDAVYAAITMEAESIKLWSVGEFLSKTITQPDIFSTMESSWLVPYARRLLLLPHLHHEFTGARFDELGVLSV